MKRIAIALLTSAAAVVGLSQAATAADLAVKAAPPPPPAPTWTGLYIGVHGGAAWQSTPTWSFNDPNFGVVPGAVPPATVGNTNASMGGVGGLQVGYNYQFAPAWVAGVEGDISWASLADHRTQSPAFPGGALTTSLQMSANTNWLASVRGKLGFTGWWNTMFYGTGGVAWASTEYTGTGVFANGFTDNVSVNHTNTGWVAGGGAEWQATTNVLLRAEYLYYKLNNSMSAAAPYVPPFGTAAPVYSWNSYNVQVARIAVSYKF